MPRSESSQHDTNREMWLSSQIASERLLNELIDELASLDRISDDGEKGLPSPIDIVRHSYQYLSREWNEALEKIDNFEPDAPDLREFIDEMQQVNKAWDQDTKSKIR